MKALEDFAVMESFGLTSNGIFSEVSELDMVDVIGGSCGQGYSCWFCPPTNWSPSLPGDAGQFGTTPGFF